MNSIETENNIVSLFVKRALEDPDRVALIYKDKSVSYGQLFKEVQSTASYFTEGGVQKGDRVMVFIPMSMNLYRTVLALFYLGATVVFLDEWVGVKKMEECCKVAQCKAFVGGWKIHLLTFFSKELKKIPIKLSISAQRGISSMPICEMDAQDTALITFTTGSTGAPKAAKRTHAFLKEQFIVLTDVLQPQIDDVDMPTLPIVLLINLGIGCTSVIPDFNSREPKGLDPQKLWQQVEKYKVNRITSSPYFIKRLSEYIVTKQKDTAQIEKIFTGGGPVFPSEGTILKRAFPQSDIKIVYGSTEAEPISSISADELVKENGNFLNVGFIYKTIELKILPIIDSPISVKNSSEFETLALAQGEIGEIVVSGPHVLTEYFNSEQAFMRNKILVGNKIWHRTGDAGCINKNGKLELAGRCEGIIIQGNQKYYPFIFENKCLAIKGILSAAMLQINSSIYIAVETKEKENRSEIISQLKGIIPDAAKIIFIKTMPKDPRHFTKIDYIKLRNILTS